MECWLWQMLSAALYLIFRSMHCCRSQVLQGGDGPSPAQSLHGWKKLNPALQVMEYCNMGSLGDAVSQGLFHNRKAPRPENLDLLAVLRSGAEIASALCYLHDGEITHGDLSGEPAGADQTAPGRLSSCAHAGLC